ncbi:hypothetical protein KA005_41460 [bacterium]|nr:hypothetical protein [bacterium]
MITKNKLRKTRYCNHYHKCDRDEDCFNGEECPVFEFNPDCASIEKDEARDFVDIMNDIWEDKR